MRGMISLITDDLRSMGGRPDFGRPLAHRVFRWGVGHEKVAFFSMLSLFSLLLPPQLPMHRTLFLCNIHIKSVEFPHFRRIRG